MNILYPQIKKLMQERGMDYDTAFDIAYQHKEKYWYIKDWKVTERWEKYAKLSEADRAILTRCIETGKKPSEYTYVDGRAILKTTLSNN